MTERAIGRMLGNMKMDFLYSVWTGQLAAELGPFHCKYAVKVTFDRHEADNNKENVICMCMSSTDYGVLMFKNKPNRSERQPNAIYVMSMLSQNSISCKYCSTHLRCLQSTLTISA